MDFPAPVVTPSHISTWFLFSAANDLASYNLSAFPVSVTWPSANLAVYTPISLPYPYAVNRVFWVNGATGGGNVDFGIYTPGGRRIYSTGSTAQSGTDTIQYATPSTTFVLSPGRYLFALSSSATTGAVYGYLPTSADVMRHCGFQQEASAVPLPATATFASMANLAIPFCGVTRTTTGY